MGAEGSGLPKSSVELLPVTGFYWPRQRKKRNQFSLSKIMNLESLTFQKN